MIGGYKVDKISGYIEQIITLIIAITIIELILPNSKNKKYVMFVCSLVILISVINPILKVFNSGIDISKTIKNIQQEIKKTEYTLSTEHELDYSIYDLYIKNLEGNMVDRLEDMGYKVLESKINVNKETYEPENIELKVKYDDGYIQPVIINVFENILDREMHEADIDEIKETLALNYGLEKSQIKVNQR